jgi:2-oxoglutarate dehydrogenase E2 component (dihydrolipoamide succinyltransferase)
MTDIVVPSLGESVSSATVARWLKKAGEAVTADEPLVELETDKVTVEVNAPVAGVIAAIAADTGAEVVPGAVLGSIQAGAAVGAAKPVAAPAPAPKPAAPAPAPVASAAGHAPMPAAAKMIAEAGVSAAAIGAGTGKDGRITKGDVRAY